jgi:cytochrome c
MKKIGLAVLVSVFFVATLASICAAGPAEDAKAMVDKAVAYIKANGKDKAFAEFNNPSGQFVKGEFYVYAQSLDGVILAHGANKALIGQNHMEVKDGTGKYFVKESAELAKTKGSGWINYSWTNPLTKKVAPKTTYIQKMDDYWVGCGYFK